MFYKKLILGILTLSLFATACDRHFSSHQRKSSTSDRNSRNDKISVRKNTAFQSKVIYFEHDSASLSEEQKRDLDRNVIKWLKAESETKIIINGYADEKANIVTSKVLAKKRADNIKNYLADKGIKETRIDTDSYSSSYTKNADQSETIRATEGGVAVIIVKKDE